MAGETPAEGRHLIVSLASGPPDKLTAGYSNMETQRNQSQPPKQDAAQDAVQYHCASCGAVNRILGSRVKDDPTCGRCKAKIFPRKTVPVTDATWKKEVENSPLPVLVDFWAPWCGPCRVIGPILEQLAGERGGRVKIAKLNIDENPRVASQFSVRSIPTMILFRGPLVVDQIVGLVPKATLEGRLDRAT